MNKKNKKLLIVASFEDASILRKFTILFLVASIVPMVLLYYIYLKNQRNGIADIPAINFKVVMILMVLGVLVGYASIRALIVKVIDISKANRKIIESFLSSQTIEEIDQEQNELVVLSRSFSAITERLEENIRNLKTTQKTLQSVMAKVGQGISNMGDINTFLQLIVETMSNALNGRVGTLMILNEKKTELIINTVYGLDYDVKKPIHLKLSEALVFEKIISEKRPVVLSDVTLQNMENPKLNDFFAESLLCAPLVYGDLVSGIITLSKAKELDGFSEEDITLLFNLASQTAIALANAKLNHDIEKTYFETISALALAVDAKDKYSRGHLDRVADYTLIIGKRLGLDDKDLRTLRAAARLHDLGKIGIPDDILRKDGPLTEQEWEIMRRHTIIGESIIKPVHSLAHLCDLIRHHHEKLDGTGYPDKLKENEISPLVRILSVVDVFDALTSERPYRPKKSRQEAVDILRSMKNHLDQNIVEVFLKELKV